MESEMEEGQQKVESSKGVRTPDRDFVLQWGNRKRLRCVKLKKSNPIVDKNPQDYFNGKTTPSRAGGASADVRGGSHRDSPMKNQTVTKSASSSPEKEDRYYSTRGSVGGLDDYGKFLVMEGGLGGGGAREEKSNGSHVWPKLFVSLSSKEKEEDFMAMKGCKLPQRPKKRAKLVQRSLLLVSPGAWLSDLCQERYEVREKKASKRRPRGLKAMGTMESDSE
ncbi:hypothetical protein QQ045_004866 [Rhodiola kirilowii]